MASKHFPRRVWDFGLKHDKKFKQMIPSVKLNDRTNIEVVTGRTLDILEHVDSYFYDLVWYHI